MDQINKEQNLKTLSQFSKSHFLKKLTKFVISVSFFSLLLSSTPGISFLHSFRNYFNVIMRLFSHTIDKNCIFLFCNGLLVFVVKCSGLISSSAKYSNGMNPDAVKYYEYQIPSMELESQIPMSGEDQNLVQSGDSQENAAAIEAGENNYMAMEENNNREPEEFIMENHEEHEQEEEDSERYVAGNDKAEVYFINDEFPVQQEEEDDEEDHGVLSTEELNKKFEEFIRRMKEEIRVEAQQQLIMVK